MHFYLECTIQREAASLLADVLQSDCGFPSGSSSTFGHDMSELSRDSNSVLMQLFYKSNIMLTLY